MKNKKGKKKKLNIRILSVSGFVIVIAITLTIVSNIKEKEIIKEAEEKTLETFASITNENENNEEIIVVEKKQPEINSKTTDWNLILINKENPIPENYQVELQNIEYSHKVDSRIADSLSQMLQDARKQGLQPYICSSYRSLNTQTTLYNRKVNQYKRQGYTSEDAKIEASYWVTLPRTSEHEIGMAVDIVSRSYQVLDERQEETKVQKWLIENCTDYGFILRYPTDKKEITKINYEPWHYRYVGVENAKFMKEKNFCLEEFIAYLKDFE